MGRMVKVRGRTGAASTGLTSGLGPAAQGFMGSSTEGENQIQISQQRLESDFISNTGF